jgi:hypothetical protein
LSSRLRSQPRKGSKGLRWTWPRPQWHDNFYFAGEETHAKIERFVEALEAAYGHAEAAGFLREACLGSGARGRDVLAWLRRRFPDRDPEAQAEPTLLEDLLDELGLFESADV